MYQNYESFILKREEINQSVVLELSYLASVLRGPRLEIAAWGRMLKLTFLISSAFKALIAQLERTCLRCDERDLGSISGSGRSPGEAKGYPL